MDSMQIYRELSVGTASPTAAEKAAAPHHLFNAFSVAEPLSCVAYAGHARRVMADIRERGRVPLLVGGTGLYLKALFEGLDELPVTPPALRQRLADLARRRGRPWLHRMLRRLDPDSADALHENDAQRIQRALEVRILSGRSIRELWGRQRHRSQQGSPPLTIGLHVERDLLHRKIRENVEKMLHNGWLDEMRALIETGLAARVLQLGPIGYRDVYRYLAGTLGWEELVSLVTVATRRYAKRQMTWFRKVDYIQWFSFDPGSGYNRNEIVALLKHKLGLASFIEIDHSLN